SDSQTSRCRRSSRNPQPYRPSIARVSAAALVCRAKPLVPSVRCVSALDKGLHPAQYTFPALAVIGSGFGVSGKTLLTQFHPTTGSHAMGSGRPQALDIAGFEFPANNGLVQAGVAGNPGMDQQAWRIHFQILAVDPEGCTICADSNARPLPSRTQVDVGF